MTSAAPAIVFIVVDQLAARWLETAWQGAVPLPNLTALRSRGLVFRRAFTIAPVCTPSRASLLTGLRPGVHGARDTGYRLDPRIPTFPRLLREAGWNTGAFGKLHLAPQLDPSGMDPHDYGFDAAALTEDSRVGAWLDWIRVEHPDHLQAALSTVWMTEHPAIDDDDELRREIAQARAAFPEVSGRAYPLPLPAELSQTAWITDRACEFIRGTPRDDPFLAYVGYVQPHDPFSPPQAFVDTVDLDAVPAPVPAAPLEGRIPYYLSSRFIEPSYTNSDWRRERALYLADLAHIDAELGRVLGALRDTDRDDVLIVFTADHGELLHDHGLIGKGEKHYDGAIRVPLIVVDSRADRRASNERFDLVDSTDLAPTVLEWAGVVAPFNPRWPDGEPLQSLPGRSLLSGPTERDAVYVESNTSDAAGSRTAWSRTLRTATHRYTRHLGGGGEQLFDLVEDPDEQHDLARNPSVAGVREQLVERLVEASAAAEYPYPSHGLFRAGSW